MQFNSIYEYLDMVFEANTNPTKAEIIEAKKQYYKLWHKAYNRKRRKTRKEFRLGFDINTLGRIKREKGTRTVSKYLYDAVFNALDGGSKSDFDNEQLVTIHQKLMQLIALVEQVLDSGESLELENLLERIEQLELQFSKLTA
ncbi:hypothetical protein [uncultured Winogradskyella sp.]|uniref:hypothetical protein n=1 Tax=uncultured Winogradskyella sp. TaxID=395353 RepID=UPI0026020760|nr:hypothetical protein [uncultured Winogradskyella sp.]